MARDLLGRRLVRVGIDGTRLSGTIVETEAYGPFDDLGCHGRSGRTARNASMWGPPGRAYVYFTYGMHWLLNLVTGTEGVPEAVLLRAVVPLEGLDTFRSRRPGRPDAELADGPAKLCRAFGLDGSFDGYDCCSPSSRLFVEAGSPLAEPLVTTGPRVGLNRVPEPWKSVPWRFLARTAAAPGAKKRAKPPAPPW